MQTTAPNIIIYHGGCPDGLAGAWVFWRKYNDTTDNDNDNGAIEYFPGRFNQDPPDVTGKNVVFVDFSYPYEITKKMTHQANAITILDHHKSANKLLQLLEDTSVSCLLSITLDMTRSGAQIAWDYVNAGKERPWFINDIGDRDMWKWEIPDSKESTRGMYSQGHYTDFTTFDQLTKSPREKFIFIGALLLKEDQRIYERICNNATDCMLSSADNKQSYKCRVVECDRMFGSDVGNLLVQDEKCDFAVMYRYIIERDEWWLSVRAKKGMNIDLSTLLPSIFGNGGGHPLASGCTIYGSKKQSLLTYFKPVAKDSLFHLEQPLTVIEQPNTTPDEPNQPLSNAELNSAELSSAELNSAELSNTD